MPWRLLSSSPCLALAPLWQQYLGLYLPRSVFSSKSCAVASRYEEVVLAADVGFSPALTKVMLFSLGGYACRG